MPQTESQRQWYIKNRERLLEKAKDYRDNNDNTEYQKEYRINHKQATAEYNKQYRIENIDKMKKYSQTEIGKKSTRISKWKILGLKSDDYDKIYERYINTTECDNCGIELVSGNKLANRRCMDHSHITGEFRNVLCNTCNVKRG